MTSDIQWRTAWITGASSGIGRELTLKLARAGTRVAASARSKTSLDDLAKLHPGIHIFPLDVRDRQATADVVGNIGSTLGPIDLAVLNAGVWRPMSATSYSAEAVAESMNVNYLGLANALEALLPGMLQRAAGHVALVSSVAGFRGLPKSIAYAPTKAAVISLAECLRHDLVGRGVKVSVVNPGFVDTPMTRVNRFPMPFIVGAESAASRILAGLERGRYEITFPWQMALLMKLARLAPNAAFFWFWQTFMAPPRRDR